MMAITLDSPSTTGRLEELVDRLLAALFPDEPEQSVTDPGVAKVIHQARRLRQSGDLEGALAALNGVDTASASESELRWLYAEWLDIARRRFAGGDTMLYSPSIGKGAVLVPTGDGNATLEVAAVLGMRWPVGKLVSRSSLRGLKPLAKGGAAWS